MIIPVLVGRLGNQAFSIANSIAYALDNNQPYHIPPLSQNPQLWKTQWLRLQNKHYNKRADVVNIYEGGHNYKPLPTFHKDWADKNVLLHGYYQSFKYFDHRRSEVLAALNIPWEPLKEFVSIHVRRGDYLKFPDKHPPVTIEYLREAIMYFVERKYKSFIVCSDDMTWCRTNLDPLRVSGAEFSYSQNRREVEDLALLSCTEHQIISNSTFSLFAHWLNRNPEKFCIAPSVWFGPGNSHLSTISMYPENCLKL